MKHNELLKELEKRMSRYGYCDTWTHIELFIKEYEAVTKDKKPIRLKDVIKRIKGFDDETKLKWTYDILKELGSDFNSKIFHEAYQQGRFDEALETHHEPEKVKVSEEEAKFLKTFNFRHDSDVTKALYYVSRTGFCYYLTDNFDTELKGLSEGFYDLENRKRLIRAILFGYEVEKEKWYLVKVKGLCGNHETLNCEKHSNKWLFSSSEENRLYRTKHTRKELEDAGFGWVFDCEDIEIEEVEE